jgi:hypothetical protein
MTTDQVNDLGDRLVAADCDGDAEKVRAVAYDLLHSLAVEHERADCLAARVHSLAVGGR